MDYFGVAGAATVTTAAAGLVTDNTYVVTHYSYY